MTRLLDAYGTGRFLVLVSPPANQPDLFQAAFEAGVDAAKVHLNVEHRASGRRFGSWSEERGRVEQILREAPCPLGVMPGAERLPDPAEMTEMAALGIEFFDIYADHMPPWMWSLPMTRMVALGHGQGPDRVPDLIQRGMQVLEASVVDPSAYGERLEQADLDAYRELAAACPVPVLVPSQKALVPGDLARLATVGVRSVLLGVLSLGSTPESFRACLPDFLAAAREVVTPRAG